MPNALPPIFVVSLARETERRALMRERLGELGLAFEFFDAIEGATVDEGFYRHRMQDEWWRVMRGRRLSPGMIGCFLSHYALWERVVAEEMPCAVVLEDDAVPAAGFADAVGAVLEADWPWEVVLLSAKKRYRVDRELARLDDVHRLVRYRRRVGSNTGYVIRLGAARRLLHYCYRIRAPIGWLYAEWWRNGVDFSAVEPAVVSIAGLPSTIGDQLRAKRTILEHAAAIGYRVGDWLYLRVA